MQNAKTRITAQTTSMTCRWSYTSPSHLVVHRRDDDVGSLAPHTNHVCPDEPWFLSVIDADGLWPPEAAYSLRVAEKQGLRALVGGHRRPQHVVCADVNAGVHTDARKFQICVACAGRTLATSAHLVRHRHPACCVHVKGQLRQKQWCRARFCACT